MKKTAHLAHLRCAQWWVRYGVEVHEMGSKYTKRGWDGSKIYLETPKTPSAYAPVVKYTNWFWLHNIPLKFSMYFFLSFYSLVYLFYAVIIIIIIIERYALIAFIEVNLERQHCLGLLYTWLKPCFICFETSIIFVFNTDLIRKNLWIKCNIV